jgi:hypothetical protein
MNSVKTHKHAVLLIALIYVGPYPVFQSSGGAGAGSGPFRLNNCSGDVAHFPDRISSAQELAQSTLAGT